MKIFEILNEGDDLFAFIKENINTDLNELVNSVLVPLVAQKVDKISIKQILDIIHNDPEINNINIDDTQLMNVLKKNKTVYKIEADPENEGLMTVFLEVPKTDREVSAKQADKEKKDINKAALRTVKKKLK